MATRRATSKRASDDKVRRAAAKRRKLRAHAEAQIEEHLRTVGFDDPAELKEQGTYRLDNGEVQGFAGVHAERGKLLYTVSAPVLPLPSDKDLVVPLMRELLEANALATGPARLAIVGDSVFAVVSDHADLVPDEDFGRYIDSTLGVAEWAVRDLGKKYGGTTRRRKR